MKTLDIPAIFKSDADDIIKCREDAIRIHGTNIRAAGNDVEMCVRDYLRRMLPPHITLLKDILSIHLEIPVHSWMLSYQTISIFHHFRLQKTEQNTFQLILSTLLGE